MVVQEQPRPTRRHVDSLERWQAALQRAMEAGLEVFTAADDDGERFITSASKLDTLHRTDGRRCSCEAAVAGDPSTARHRAVVRFVMGWLPTAETRPVAAECLWCAGRGMVQNEYHQRYDRCDSCSGKQGVRIDRRLTGQPAVEIVGRRARADGGGGMKRYRIVAVLTDGTTQAHGPYQNVFVADGFAKALLVLCRCGACLFPLRRLRPRMLGGGSLGSPPPPFTEQETTIMKVGLTPGLSADLETVTFALVDAWLADTPAITRPWVPARGRWLSAVIDFQYTSRHEFQHGTKRHGE